MHASELRREMNLGLSVPFISKTGMIMCETIREGASMCKSCVTRLWLILTVLLCIGSAGAFAQATQVRVETMPDGTGTIVPAQSLALGETLVVYAISRTAGGVFVANVVADVWALDSIAGGVVAGDLVPHANRRSATFRARLTGSANIRATFGLLTPVRSGKITVVPGPAKKLAFIQGPTNANAGAAIAPPITVQIQDSVGNSVPTPAPGLQINLAIHTGTGVLGGTVARLTDATGRATFNDVSVNLVGIKTLKATRAGLDSAVSASFTINPGAAKKLVFIQQPTTTSAGTIITPPITVQVQDTFGNNVRTPAPGLAITVALNSGTGVLGGTLVRSTDTTGLATFNNLSLNISGAKTLKATRTGLDSAVSTAFTINAAAPKKLLFVQQPTNTPAGTSINPPITVQVQDTFGNSVRTPAPGLLVNLALNSGTGVLGGTLARSTDTTGLATFNDVNVNLIGLKTVKATRTGLDSAISTSFTVSAAPAKKLVFVQQPTNDTAGTIITPPITVQVQDTFGNNVAGVVSVVMTIHSGTGVLSGTTTKSTSAAGLATFDNLSINLTGAKQLKANNPGLDSAVSVSFTINPAAASRLAIQVQPSATATAGVVFAQQPVVRIEDAFGNLVTTNNSTSVTATRSAGTGTLQGTTTLTASGGLVSFTNLRHNVSGTISIQFTSLPVLTPVTSTNIVVSPAAASKLVFTQQPTNTVSGSAITPALTVQLQDTFSNNVLQSGRPVLMTLSSGTGVLSGTTTQNTNASGVATFSNLNINLVGTKALTATSTGLVSAISSSFQITVGPPATVVATAGTPQSALVNTAFSTNLRALVRDAAGNVISGATVTFTAPTTGARGTFAGGLSTINVATDTNGIATATVFTANIIAGSYNVTASVVGVPTPATYALTNTAGPPRQIAATAGTPQSTQIATAFPVNFQTTVRDTFGNLLSGIVVTFTAPSSGPSGTFAGGVNTSTTNVSGVATAAVFSANIIAGSYQLTATAPGITTPAAFALTNLPGTPTSVTATAGTPQSAQVGTAFATNLTALVRDGASNPVPGILVRFKKPATGASGTFAGGIDTVRTDANGVAVAPVFTANLIAGSYNDSAVVTGVPAPAIYQMTNTSGPPGNITVVAGTPQSAVVNTAFATSLQVLVRDAVGNPVNNVTVTFTAPSTGPSGKFGGLRVVTAPTNVSGIATAPTFTADTLAGSYQVTASAPDVTTPALFAMTNNPGAASRILATAGTPQSAQIGTAFATNFRVRVTDAFDNPIGGNLVTFTPPATGPSGAFQGNVNTTTTDSTGAATAVVFTANFIAGTYNLPATATGVATPAQFVLTNTAGTPQTITPTAGTPQSARVNTQFAASLQAIVRDGAGNPASGITVTFTAPVSGASARFSNGQTTFTTTSSGAGIASATVFANTIVGSYAVNATVSGVASPAIFLLTNTPGIAASVSATAGTPQATTVNTAFPVQFQATVRDSFNNVVPGVLVTFSGTGGSFVGGVDTARTNSGGVATAAVFVAGTVAGAHTVNASVPGVTAPAAYSLTNLAGSPESVFATAGTPQSTQVNTAFATQLAVAVRDSFNNPVPNVIVTFTVPLTGPSGVFAGGVNIATTNSAGVATAPVLTANSTAGQYIVTASVPGVSSPAQFFLTNVPGQAASIIPTAGTPQSAQVNTPFATNFSVLVRDASGNPVRNLTVTFTVPSSGPGGMFAGGGNFTTDSNGVVTAPQFTANTTAGRYTVNATVAGVPTPAQFQLTNTPGVANSVVLAGGSGQSTTVGTVFPVPLQALVRDNWNNPVPGILVTFTSPSTGPSCNFAGFAIGTATTDTNGIASIIAIANQLAGSYNVVATVSGISTPANFSLSNTAAAPATIIATAGTPQSAQVGTVFSTPLQALVRDGFSNPVPNALVQFTPPATGPSGTFQNNIDTVRTNSGGVATARPFTANLIAGGPYSVTAGVTGVTETASYLLTNLTGPPGSITILQGTPQITTVGTAFPVQFRVQVRDSANNPVVNTPVTFFPPQGGVGGFFQGTGGGPIDVPTNQSGISEAPVFIANTIAGSYSVGASAPSVSSPATFQMTNRPGAPKRLYSVAGTPQSAQISTAFATNFQAAVEDSFANMVPNVLVKWTQPSSGPSGSFSGGRDTARTLANGIATAPVFVANIIAGTYTVRATTAGVVDTANYSLRNTPGSPATISVFQGSGQSTIVNTSFGSTLQAFVTDGAGNGVGGVLVQFSVPLTGPSCVFLNGIDTVRTQENGIANSQPFSANSVAGTYLVSASAPGVSQPAHFTLTNRPTVPATIVATAGTPQSAQVNTNFATQFRAVVRDSFANPISGWRVTFIAPSSGPGGSFQGGGNQWMTNDSGVVTANTFTANGTAGSYVVQAFAENLSATASYNLTNTPGQAGNVTVVAGNQQSAAVNTLFSLPLSVRVTDGSGNPVGGVSVTFTAPATGPSGTFPGGTLSRIVQTDTGGIARADSFRANTVAGSYDVNATVQGLAGTGTFTLSNTVGPLNAFVVEAAGGGNIPAQLTRVPFSVRISAKDAFNNTVSTFTGTVTITSNGRLFSGGGVTSTFSNGQLTHQIVMDKAGSGITITATRTSGGTQTGTSNAFQVNNPVPTLTSVTPAIVSLLETVVLVMRGTGFIDTVTTVNVGTGITINSVVVDSLTQLRANVTVTSSATTGDRNITVSNGAPGGGTSNQIALTVDMPVPPAPTLSGGPADSSMNVDSTLTLSWSPAPLAITYNLQVSTVATFATPVINDETLTSTSRIVLLKGNTLYFWRVRAKNSRGFGPFSAAKSFTTLPAYPQAYSLSTTVVYPDRPTQGDYLPTDYRIVGLPGDGLRGGITIPQLLPGTQNVDWIVYRDNGADQNYFEPYDGNPSFSLAPGRAFWVLKKGIWSITSVSVPTATLNTQNQSVQIGLQNGWNLITNPYTLTIPWSVVRAANGNFSDPIYGFNGAFSVSEFLPYGGYYFFNSGSLNSLRIPFGNYTSVGKSGESRKQGEWQISMEYSAQGYTDNTLVFGVLSDSRHGLDSLEYRKPRAFDGIPTVYFNRSEWDPRYSSFAADFRPEVDRLETWTFDVRAKVHENVSLRFKGIEDVPEALNVYLIDRQRARYADLRKEAGYAVPLPTGSAELEIAVGTEEAIREVLSSIIPREFALGNNFPNPFNPITTIPIAIPHTADVTLKIYNTLGQEVRTVFAGTLEAGRYFYTWDGRNESGSTVASGIYFARFRALNGPTFTGKMILLK